LLGSEGATALGEVVADLLQHLRLGDAPRHCFFGGKGSGPCSGDCTVTDRPSGEDTMTSSVKAVGYRSPRSRGAFGQRVVRESAAQGTANDRSAGEDRYLPSARCSVRGAAGKAPRAEGQLLH
jgi:hypothetical protein